jgi:NAD(P)-dependent dehydrogenase (short-subunit alcohol dehydrogenase family)
MARSFAAQGCAVSVVDERGEVESVAESIGASMFIGDVAEDDFVSDVVSAVGKVDVLVNSAGEVWPTGPFDAWDEGLDDYDRIIGTNLRGAFLFGRAVAAVMSASSGGNIINVSSDHVKPAPGTGWHHGHGALNSTTRPSGRSTD